MTNGYPYCKPLKKEIYLFMMTIIIVMCEFFWEISFSFLPKYYTYLKKLITYAIHKIQKEVETFFFKTPGYVLQKLTLQCGKDNIEKCQFN